MQSMSIRTRILLAAPILLAPVAAARAQTVRLPAGALGSDSALAAAAPRLGALAAAAYAGPDRETHLDNLFRLRLLAGEPLEAVRALDELRGLGRTARPARAPERNLHYEILAAARVRQASAGIPFDSAFRLAFRERLATVDDRTAAVQVRWVFGTSLVRLQNDLRTALDRARSLHREHPGESAVELPVAEAVELARRYLAVEAYREFATLVPPLLAEDDRRRYLVDRDVRVATPDGATVCALVVRPRGAAGRLPALLEFTVYADGENNLFEARRSAAHGYAGVAGLSRGKGCSPDTPAPAEHDGADAAALIAWIARQPWSDGRVGMFGGSYDGFTQWAAAKHRPPALKAIMPSVTFAPAVDFPMEGGVFITYAYPWPFYTTNTRGLDSATYFDAARWRRLEREWYAGGRAYRRLEEIDGAPNPLFRRWIAHPTRDAYWRAMIPDGEEFARIGIPVLTTTGYFDSGEIGALHYFREHQRWRPGAEHYLVIGPYDHPTGQWGTVSPLGLAQTVLRGLALDSSAALDLMGLRYAWFDFVLRGGPKPALLADRVNFQVMGADRWRHAASLAAMRNGSLRLYAAPALPGGAPRLTRVPAGGIVAGQTVDLADRRDADAALDTLVDLALDTWDVDSDAPRLANTVLFASAPLTAPVEVSGLFRGRLEFIANKRDVDLGVTLYERTAAGRYLYLSHYWTRASLAGDPSRRTLLVPGRPQRISFESGRLTSRLLAAGSRVVVALSVIKQPGEQINYGTGKDVSDETIADAGAPLRIRWLGGTCFELPTWR